MTTTAPERRYTVKTIAVRDFTCARCGRRAVRRRTFCRRVKCRDTETAVRAVVEQLASAWQPTMHRNCEQKTLTAIGKVVAQWR